MRRTVRGLIVSMMPSLTAWRARSWLAQWVMCSPLATGSRQARATIWAFCRGGNLQGPPRTWAVQQQFRKSAPLVAPADPPDGRPVALEACGDGLYRLTASDRQDDAGVLD